MKDGVKLVNDLAHQLAISDVHLSMENSRALEQINIRWKQLQVEEHPEMSHGEASCYGQALGKSVRRPNGIMGLEMKFTQEKNSRELGIRK